MLRVRTMAVTRSPIAVPGLVWHRPRSVRMKNRVASFVGIAAVAVVIVRPALAQPRESVPFDIQHERMRIYEGTPVTLSEMLDEATANNPELLALRTQIDVVRQRP